MDAQLTKVKQKVMKSTAALEKSYRKQDKAIEVVNKSLIATALFTRTVFGQTIRVEKVLGWWSTHALNFHRKMVRNLLILEKFGSLAKNVALTFGKGFLWAGEKAYSGIQKLIGATKVLEKEVNESWKVWSMFDVIIHPIKAVKEAIMGLNEETGKLDIAAESAKILQDELDALGESAWEASRVYKRAAQAFEAFEAARVQRVTPKRIEPGLPLLEGQTMQMVLFGVPGMFTAIYDAAKWAFGGILDIVTSVFQKIVGTSIWVKTGVIAAFVGMYYKITQAAMDAEDALSFNELGVTRTALKRFKDALTEVLAALGKPFLSGIRAVSNAVADWLEKSTPKITAWAEKFAEKLEWLRNAFVDWVVFLSTDFKGGISVALQVVAELFKGLGDVLILTMEYVGRVAAKTLMDTFIFGIESWLPKATRVADKKLKRFGKWLLKVTKPSTKGMTRFTGIPLGQTEYQRMPVKPRVQTEEESLTQQIIQAAKDRAENIKKILEGMPTWGDTEAVAATKAAPIIMAEMSAMAEHRRKMLEAGATLSDSEWAIQNERMIAELEHAAKKLKKAQDFAATRQGMLSALDFEYNLLGRTNDERERAIELANFQAELAKDTSLSMETQNELMDEYASKLDRLIEKQSSLGYTVQQWMNKAGEMGKNLGNLLTNTFDSMADSLADALMGMTMDWKAFGRMFIKQLLAMIIKLQIAFAIQTAMGFMSGGMATAPSGLSYIPAGAGPGGLQHGGEVLETGWAKVHKGEVYSGVNNEMGFGGVTVNNYASDVVDVEVMDEGRVIEIARRVSIQAAGFDGEYRTAHKLG